MRNSSAVGVVLSAVSRTCASHLSRSSGTTISDRSLGLASNASAGWPVTSPHDGELYANDPSFLTQYSQSAVKSATVR